MTEIWTGFSGKLPCSPGPEPRCVYRDGNGRRGSRIRLSLHYRDGDGGPVADFYQVNEQIRPLNQGFNFEDCFRRRGKIVCATLHPQYDDIQYQREGYRLLAQALNILFNRGDLYIDVS